MFNIIMVKGIKVVPVLNSVTCHGDAFTLIITPCKCIGEWRYSSTHS